MPVTRWLLFLPFLLLGPARALAAPAPSCAELGEATLRQVEDLRAKGDEASLRKAAQLAGQIAIGRDTRAVCAHMHLGYVYLSLGRRRCDRALLQQAVREFDEVLARADEPALDPDRAELSVHREDAQRLQRYDLRIQQSNVPQAHLKLVAPEASDQGPLAPLPRTFQLPLPLGCKQTLEFVAPLRETERQELTISPGLASTLVELNLTRFPIKRWWFWTGLGVVAAGVAAAIAVPLTRERQEPIYELQ